MTIMDTPAVTMPSLAKLKCPFCEGIFEHSIFNSVNLNLCNEATVSMINTEVQCTHCLLNFNYNRKYIIARLTREGWASEEHSYQYAPESKNMLFSTFKQAMKFMRLIGNGRVTRAENPSLTELFEWNGHYEEHYIKSLINGYVNSSPSTIELDILKNIIASSHYDFRLYSKPIKSATHCFIKIDVMLNDIAYIARSVERLNQIAPFGINDWRIPSKSELQSLEPSNHGGKYWFSDSLDKDIERSRKDTNLSPRLSFCGNFFDSQNQTEGTVYFKDSKHVNGTCRFEGGGYTEKPNILLIKSFTPREK